jgi:ParB-like chromosome segregation protein Spo0J
MRGPSVTKKPAPKKKPGSQADGVRGTLWYFEVHEPTVVGHDTDEQEHELCHHASNKFDAEHYDEYINYMRLHGVVKPIVFRRDGDRILVVDGRTTVRVARVVAPLWEADRRAEGVKDAKFMIPAVVRKGTADELFCASRAANRRRPEDSPIEQAKDVARLVNGGATTEQAAVRLGLPVARAGQLLTLLELHPKVQRQVGAGVSLDAAVKLAKLPEAEQVAKLAEIQATGEKPTARAVQNKLREGSGRAPIETPARKLKKIAEAIADSDPPSACETCGDHALYGIVATIRDILRPQSNGAAQPAEQEAEFGG